MLRSAPPGTGRVPRRPRVNSESASLDAFLANSQAAIMVVAGGYEGVEFVLDRRRVLIGRGPGADLTIDDSSLRGLEAALEFRHGAYHLRRFDRAANPSPEEPPMRAQRLKSHDHFRLGALGFEYTISTDRRNGPTG